MENKVWASLTYVQDPELCAPPHLKTPQILLLLSVCIK